MGWVGSAYGDSLMRFRRRLRLRPARRSPSVMMAIRPSWAGMPPSTQRLIAFLLHNPGASSLEVARACRTIRVNKRVSDARRAGYHIETTHSDWGVSQYWLSERRQPAEAEESELIA